MFREVIRTVYCSVVFWSLKINPQESKLKNSQHIMAEGRTFKKHKKKPPPPPLVNYWIAYVLWIYCGLYVVRELFTVMRKEMV